MWPARSHTESVPTAQIQPLVQDALDSIEFVTGGTDTRWGALRAAMGHLEPWALNYIGIGNEARGCAVLGLLCRGSLGHLRKKLLCVAATGRQHLNRVVHAHAMALALGTASKDWESKPVRGCCGCAQDCGKPFYVQNYNVFFGAIRALYPHMRLVANCHMGQDAPTDMWDWSVCLVHVACETELLLVILVRPASAQQCNC